MAHIQPGDIIFFKPAGIVSRLNVLGQSILTRRAARWSHVALCVHGPLVIHATPRHKDLPTRRGVWLALTGAPSAGHRSNPGAHEGGAHLELLEHEFLEGAAVPVMRLRSASTEAGFEDRLREATTYWLAQQYSFLTIYLAQLRRGVAAVLPGRSFCSFLVQQVFARMGLDQIGTLETADAHALMPGELFDRLSSDSQRWQFIESASLAGSEAEELLTDDIRRRHPSPSAALAAYVAPYTATMATMTVDARGRILQIEQVHRLNRLFTLMRDIREQIVRATSLAPPAEVQKLINHVQSETGPLLDRVNAAIGSEAAPMQDLLFLNFRPLVSIVLAPKGSSTIHLQNHWMATEAGATLRGPDEDFVDRYIVSQNAIVATIELRRMGAVRVTPDPRWDLPLDLPATLTLIEDDIQRIDACRLSDWHVQRKDVRQLLIRMKNIVIAASAP